MKLNTHIKSFKIRILSIFTLFVFIWAMIFSYRAFANVLWTQKDDSMIGEWQVLRSSASGLDIVGIFRSYADQLDHVKYSPDHGDSWIDITPNDPDVDDEDEFLSSSPDKHVWSDVAISEDGVHLVLSDNNSDGGHSYVWYTPNNAFIWSRMINEGQLGNGAWNSVSLANEGQDLAVSDGVDGHNIFVSTDEGSSWNDEAPYAGDWQSVSFSPNGNFLAATDSDQGKIYVSPNQGGVWDDTEAPIRLWRHIAVADGGHMIADTFPEDGSDVYARKSIDDSFSWVDTDFSFDSNGSIDISDDGTKLAVGEIPGYIFTASINAPTVWTAEDYEGSPGSGYWKGLTLSYNGTGIAAGGYATEVWITDGVELPPVATRRHRSSGSSVQSRVKNLIAIDKKEDAEKLIKEFPAQFSSSNNLLPIPTNTPPFNLSRVLKMGMKGDDVKWLQGRLGGLVIDGDFGPKTKASVMLFQKNHDLVQDGIVGSKTNTILNL